MDNNIWFSDINIILNKDNLFNIVPTQDMSSGEKVNSITRFAFYLSVMLYLVSGNYLYFYIVLTIILVTYMIYIFNTKEFFNKDLEPVNSDDNENTDINSITELNSDCQSPTKENPLMNPLLGKNPYKNKEACSIQNNTVLDKIDKKFCDKLFQSTSSIFNNRNNQRQFYTVPNTGIPNDQTAFANWLYKTPVSCALGDSGLLKQYRACSYNSKTLNENLN